MTDDVLVEVISDLDNYFAKIIDEYEIDPLALTSIILARILLINENCGSADDFRQLMSEVALKTTTPRKQNSIH